MNELKRSIIQFIDHSKGDILNMCRYIYENPEVGYQEMMASRKLVEVLSQHGLNSTSPLAGLETAFISSIGNESDTPHVAFLAEYDALPDIGHGCGHHLISAVALAAYLAIANIHDHIGGKCSLIGTPAEEMLVDSGKMRLIKAGLFDDIDAAMISHPHNRTSSGESFLAVNEISFHFVGQSAHAAADPHLGRNAFDAIQLTFIGLNFLRQQLRSDARVHWGDVKIIGAKNIIPAFSSAVIDVRSGDNTYTQLLTEKAINCIEGAGLMTSCLPKYTVQEGYRTFKINSPFEEFYERNLHFLGCCSDSTRSASGSGSTDMGNVSQIVPSIHPFFKVGEGIPLHSVAFREACGSEMAFESAMQSAKALAMTAADLFLEPGCLKRIKEDFEAI